MLILRLSVTYRDDEAGIPTETTEFAIMKVRWHPLSPHYWSNFQKYTFLRAYARKVSLIYFVLGPLSQIRLNAHTTA